jgi:hypothetical protein
VTDKEHMQWMATVIQHLSYEINELCKIMTCTIKGETTYRFVGGDDPGSITMTPKQVRHTTLNSIIDSVSWLKVYHRS